MKRYAFEACVRASHLRVVSEIRGSGGHRQCPLTMAFRDEGMRRAPQAVPRYWWRDYAAPTLPDNTRDCYAGIWERHVRHRLGGYRLRDVTPAVVARLKADLTKEGVGPATIHKMLAIVSGMFRHA